MNKKQLYIKLKSVVNEYLKTNPKSFKTIGKLYDEMNGCAIALILESLAMSNFNEEEKISVKKQIVNNFSEMIFRK